MKKALLTPLFLTLFLFTASGQDSTYAQIDRMLIFGEYHQAIDSCKALLLDDSLNAVLWYKLGLAWKNLQPDDHSFECFLNAAECDPENRLYKFNVAKGYFNKNKNIKAKPLLLELCTSDSTNWDYASYLTGIYMEEGSYNKAIEVYDRFYNYDSTNYIVLDKLGFANLRKGKWEESIDFYTRSLKINNRNIDAIRNLSFLYPYVNMIDTAITLLDRAIGMDPDDIDLYARRGTINWAKEYNKRALNDYLKILSLGDSSFLYLKRAGIGYVNNMQAKEGLKYLMMAHRKDTSDYETIDYIAQCYTRLNDKKKSVMYYEKIVALLEPIAYQLGVTHFNKGQAQGMDNRFKEALTSYQQSYELTKTPSVLMIIANVYDENLNNPTKAMPYYRQFLNTYTTGGQYTLDYINAIKERLQYLENQQKEAAAKAKYDK